jgi:isopentenyl-diphosphate delta-isomerase
MEHEYDHVFKGQFDGTPRPNPAEVAQWRLTDVDELLADREQRPAAYTAWFWKALETLAPTDVVGPVADAP